MHTVTLFGNKLHLLPEKAIFIQNQKLLLVADVHLGKPETFQAFGVPIATEINQATLDRLQQLCRTLEPDDLFILGDLFHSQWAIAEEVVRSWQQFLATTPTRVQLIVGNHDRPLGPALDQFPIQCSREAIQLDNLVLSHAPVAQATGLNICGHIHPCVRIKTRLDNLRLPCFYLDHGKTLILPAFGEFTGGYELPLKANSTAFVIAENTVVPIAGR